MLEMWDLLDFAGQLQRNTIAAENVRHFAPISGNYWWRRKALLTHMIGQTPISRALTEGRDVSMG